MGRGSDVERKGRMEEEKRDIEEVTLCVLEMHKGKIALQRFGV